MYKIINDLQGKPAFILRKEDGAFIPYDSHNRDYAIYLDWVAEGNTAEPADTPPVTPSG